MRGSRDRLIRATLMGACALAFVLLAGTEYAGADTRLIAHFEDDGGTDPYGRDVLAQFYDSQTAAPEENLFPNSLTADNLEPFSLPNVFFSSGGTVSTDPFELHQYDTNGGAPGLAGLIGECRFAAFGSGWSLGMQDQVEDFHINFIDVGNETTNDDDYVAEQPDPWSAQPALTDNNVTGVVQDWSSYDYLCFYMCINTSEIPVQQFFEDFKIQLWEYWVDVTPGIAGAPPTVNHNAREIWEVSLWDYMSDAAVGMQPFTGWKHFRIPLTMFECLENVPDSWRYQDTVSEAALDDVVYEPGHLQLDKSHIRAIIFRKGTVDPTAVMVDPPDPDDVTVAIDEIVVTGDTNARVARINVPGATSRCDDNEDRGLCWAQLFANDANVDEPTVQDLPYSDPVQPWTLVNPCIDVTVRVRDWQDLATTFSAEVDEDAEVADDDFSSEIVFVPQFQAPGTWVERWGGDFSRRKGTLVLPGSSAGDPFHLFYTDWRYDYTNNNPSYALEEEHYLIHYPDRTVVTDPFVRLDPSIPPEGGFLANYFREHGYAYGTLFVLPRDEDGNIGRAEVIDVLFRSAAARRLHHDRLTTGLP